MEKGFIIRIQKSNKMKMFTKLVHLEIILKTLAWQGKPKENKNINQIKN